MYHKSKGALEFQALKLIFPDGQVIEHQSIAALITVSSSFKSFNMFGNI